jgi:GTP-binding protein
VPARLSTVAIVGRPNVGKSSLLNRIAGRRVSIVEPTAGVTRDRISVRVDLDDGRAFELVDMGGLGLVDEALLKQHVESQIDAALGTADIVVFVVDGKEGLVPGDQLVAQRLRRSAGERGRPVLLCVNKVESYSDELSVAEWARLGFGDPLPVSAKEGFGIADLLSAVGAHLPEEQAEPEVEGLKLAIVGKRNSGKSTLVNRLVGEERVIVSDLPGTTRDAVDVPFVHGDRAFVAIDTAGARKKSSLHDAIELFSYTRATQSIRRADVVLHLFDVREKISQVDKKLAAYCAEYYKPTILVANKVDLAPQVDLGEWDAYIKQQLPLLDHAPVVFASALHGNQVPDLLDLAVELDEMNASRMPTRELNDTLHEARERLKPRSKSKLPKLYYATQIRTKPATVLVFVNEPKLFQGQYERYLVNVLRKRFDLEEVQIRMIFRGRKRRAAEKGRSSIEALGAATAAEVGEGLVDEADGLGDLGDSGEWAYDEDMAREFGGGAVDADDDLEVEPIDDGADVEGSPHDVSDDDLPD